MDKAKNKVEEYFYTDLREQKEKYIPITVIAMLFFTVGMGFSCFEGPGGISPFAVSFLSAVPFYCCLPSFAGSVLGCFMTESNGALVRYIGALMIISLFRLIINRHFREKENGILSSFIAFCSLLFSGFIYLWIDGIAVLPALLILCESNLCLFSALLFKNAFSLPFYKGSIEFYSKKDLFSLVVSLSIGVMCICSITVQGLSPGKIFAIAVMMFICLYKGAGFSAAAGAVTGAFLSLSPQGDYLFPAFVIACLVGGFFSDSGQAAVSVSFTATFLIISLLCCNTAENMLCLIEPVIACGVFLLIPANKISELEEHIDKIFAVRKKTDSFALTDTLKSASLNMESVATMVDDVSKRLDKIINPEVNRLFSLIQQKVCDQCDKKSFCWNKNFDRTVSDILKILEVEKKGDGQLKLSVICKDYALLCRTLSAAYPSYINAVANKNKITEMRRILTDQFSGMSDFLYDLSLSISESRTRDKRKSAFLRTALSDSGIPLERLDCYFYEGRVTLEIYLPLYDSTSASKIKPVIEYITKRRFEEPEPENTGSYLLLVYKEKASYTVRSGYSQRSMKAGKMCGDTVSIFTSDNGGFNFIISDGMGTGSRAAIDSNLTVSVLEKLICSSFPFESACKTVNNALIIKSTDESLATVDALQINPYTGKAVFYKAGGAASIIRHTDTVSIIEKPSLPLGIIRDVPVIREEKQLKKGDIILMLSDGVTNSDCGWINDELLAWSKSDMQSLAGHIASLAALRSESSTRDDITVVAVRIESTE